MPKTKSKGAVEWILPGKKRPFTYSTIAQSALITALARKYDTPKEIIKHIHFGEKEKEILRYFIDKCYGDCVLRDYLDYLY